MRRAATRAILLATALLALPGCVRVVTVPASAIAPPREAVLDKLALVVPLTDQAAPYVAVPWHRARLTIGRHDGTMAEITHVFESTRAGLRGVGGFPALPPGDGYWIRVELVQDGGDGLERVVGRGWAGDADEAGVELLAGGNLAKLNIKPTVLGTQLALSPVRPPAPREEVWRPRWDADVQEVAAPVRRDVELEMPAAAAPVLDYDDRKRDRHEIDEVLDDADDAAWSNPAAYDASDAGYGEDAYEAAPLDDDDDEASEDSYEAPEADDDADVPTGDVIDSFSAYKALERNR